MAINKETKSLGMPWEKEYGYAQAVKVGETIYLSGQVSHDEEGNIVGLRYGDSDAADICQHSEGAFTIWRNNG